MIIMILIFACLIAMVGIFTISMNMNIVNREIMATPKSIFERSIPIAQETNIDELILYFDKELLESELTYYYDYSFKKYVKEYTLNITYFENADGSFCLSQMCSSVNVEISCFFALNFHLSRKLAYSIVEGSYA